MKNLSNLVKKLIMVLVLVVGFAIGSIIPNSQVSNSESVKDVTVFTDTLVLENQGEIDLYAVDGGKWIVISLDDLKYVIKKQRKTIVSDLESLFERFEVPERINIKPTFK